MHIMLNGSTACFNRPLPVKPVSVLDTQPQPLTVMFCNCDKALLLLEVMHLTKVKSDLITAAVREGCYFAGSCGKAQEARQRWSDNVLMSCSPDSLSLFIRGRGH